MKNPNTIKIATVAVLFISVAALIWGKAFVAYAEQFIDSFTDTTRISRMWNVSVSTSTGEVRLAERSCDDATWFCASSTVCANTAGDGANIIVKRTNEAQAKQWKIAATACDKPHCLLDGGQDGDVQTNDNTVNFINYPARDACKESGGRLPTRAELVCIYNNQVGFGNNFGDGFYWSGTENSATVAWYVYFSDGITVNGNKTYSNSVRCVKGW